jgi:hypothetical protein
VGSVTKYISVPAGGAPKRVDEILTNIPTNLPTGTLIVQEADSDVDLLVGTLDFGAGFDVTSSPPGEANIALDLSEVAGGGDLSWPPTSPPSSTTRSPTPRCRTSRRPSNSSAAAVGGGGNVQEVAVGAGLDFSGPTLAGTLGAKSAITAAAAIANTENLVASLSIPANSLAAGATFRIYGGATLTSGATPGTSISVSASARRP